MKGNRMGRVDEEVRREIGVILQQKARDPRLQWVSITRVEVSRDLSVAQVYFSTIGDEDAKAGAVDAMVKAGPFLRAELGRGLRLRRTPELRFRYDGGIEHSLRINQMLSDLGVLGTDPEGDDPAAGVHGDPAADPELDDPAADVDDDVAPDVDDEPATEDGSKGAGA